jgi:tetratricopeptide (TPR) repeat protein
MNKSLIILILIATLASFHYAQQPNTEIRELTDKMLVLSQKGNFEESVAVGEKLVQLESAAKDSVSYTNATINLARLKRAYFVSLRNKIVTERLGLFDAKPLSQKADKNADDAEALFREALELNEKNGRGQTAQTAGIKKDLSWLMTNHIYSGKKTVGNSRSRIDEAEKLLIEALALSEQTGGKDADETLFIVLDAGDFYYKYVNFEKSLPFYERFIQTYAQKHGSNHPDLVAALRPYAKILFATSQNGESAAAVSRIESITKTEEPKLRAEIDLHLRSKDSVAYAVPIFMEMNDKAESLRNKLKAEGRILNIGDVSLMPRAIIIPVEVEVDETGKITKAVAKNGSAQLRSEAETIISKWTVRPFSSNGTMRKMRGILNYWETRLNSFVPK